MMRDFMSDRRLQTTGIIMTDVAGPLEDRYAADLEAQLLSDKELLDWCAIRALGGSESWWNTVTLILVRPHRPTLYQRLRLTPPCEVPVDPEEAWLAEDISIVDDIYKISWVLASELAWTDIIWKWTMPLGAAVLVSSERSVRSSGMDTYYYCQWHFV